MEVNKVKELIISRYSIYLYTEFVIIIFIYTTERNMALTVSIQKNIIFYIFIGCFNGCSFIF